MEAFKRMWHSFMQGVATFWASMPPEARSLFVGIVVGFFGGMAFTGLVFCL